MQIMNMVIYAVTNVFALCLITLATKDTLPMTIDMTQMTIIIKKTWLNISFMKKMYNFTT